MLLRSACVCDGVSDVSLGLHIFACQDEDVPTLQMYLDFVTLSLSLARSAPIRAADIASSATTTTRSDRVN